MDKVRQAHAADQTAGTSFIDADVPDGSRDTFRYRTAIVDEEDNGNKIFVVPGAKYVPNDKLWWRDLTPPECAKHYEEGNSK